MAHRHRYIVCFIRINPFFWKNQSLCRWIVYFLYILLLQLLVLFHACIKFVYTNWFLRARDFRFHAYVILYTIHSSTIICPTMTEYSFSCYSHFVFMLLPYRHIRFHAHIQNRLLLRWRHHPLDAQQTAATSASQ